MGGVAGLRLCALDVVVIIMPIAGRNTVTDHALVNHVIVVISPVLVSRVLPVPPYQVSSHGLARVGNLVLTIFAGKKEKKKESC